MKAWRRTSRTGTVAVAAPSCGVPTNLFLEPFGGDEVGVSWQWAAADPGGFDVEYDVDGSGLWNVADGSPTTGDLRGLIFATGEGPGATIRARVRARCTVTALGDWVISNGQVIPP